jgi:hypothetical protein
MGKHGIATIFFAAITNNYELSEKFWSRSSSAQHQSPTKRMSESDNRRLPLFNVIHKGLHHFPPVALPFHCMKNIRGTRIETKCPARAVEWIGRRC